MEARTPKKTWMEFGKIEPRARRLEGQAAMRPRFCSRRLGRVCAIPKSIDTTHWNHIIFVVGGTPSPISYSYGSEKLALPHTKNEIAAVIVLRRRRLVLLTIVRAIFSRVLLDCAGHCHRDFSHGTWFGGFLSRRRGNLEHTF